MYLIKKKLIYTIAFFLCMGNVMISQAQNIGINNTGDAPDNSAMLDISATDKGVLIPRMDSTSRMNIAAPAEGLMVFDSTYHSFYFYDGTAWSAIGGNDNLGSHMANQNLQLKNNWLNNDGDANEGIMVDTLGNVGIGRVPDGIFHIDMGHFAAQEHDFHHSPFWWNNWVDPAPGWQSITATKTGLIQQIRLPFYGANGVSRTLSIYEGEGTFGNLLFTGDPVIVTTLPSSNDWVDFPIDNVTIQAGQKYTIALDNAYLWVFSKTPFATGYPGGTCDLALGRDYSFGVSVAAERAGFKVQNDAVVFDNYSMPLIDGANGQVLHTDGSGTLSWTDKTTNTDNQDLSLSGHSLALTNDATPVDLSGYLDNTDAQDLSLSSNSLSLTNDGTPVDLSGYLDNTDAQDLSLSGNSLSLTNDGTPVDLSGYSQDLSLSGNTLSLTNDGTTVDLSSFAGGPDEMGNHTANQNIQLDTFWLSGDGGDEGIRIDNTGKVGFGRAVGTLGVPKFEYYGANGSNEGPHIQVVNSGDDHPLFQQLNWTHDNIALSFDAYYDGAWVSSNSIANYNIYKIGGRLTTHYSSGKSPGSTFTWSLGTSLDTLGRFGIGRTPTTNKLEVEGNASKTTAGNWLANSDARLKKNISQLSSEGTLNKLLALRGVTYEWNDTQTGTKRPEGIQYGFTAQNIQEVFPTLVTEDNNGFLQTPYGTYDAMTVEAIRALNDKIEKLAAENNSLKTQNAQVQSRLAEIDELKNAFAQLEAALNNNSTKTDEAIEAEK